MKIFQLLKLSHADFMTRRKTIALSVLAASIPCIILLVFSILGHGAERIVMHESGKISQEVYLLLGTNTDSLSAIKNSLETSLRNGGELIAQITPEQLSAYEQSSELFADLTDFDLSKVTLTPDRNFLNTDGEDNIFQNFHISQLFFSMKVATYLPAPEINDLEHIIQTMPVFIIKFPNPESAYHVRQLILKDRRSFPVLELFNNRFTSYTYFHNAEGINLLLQIAFLIITGVIAIGTYIYLLDQSMHSMVVYRALGANTFDLIIIALGYIIEVSLTLIVFTLGVAILIALLMSGLDASYLTQLLTDFYGFAPSNTLMIGFGRDTWLIIATILLTAPLSVILTLDQFSVKRLSQKLKRD